MTSTVTALANAAAILVSPHDVAGTLSAQLRGCLVALRAEACCLLVGNAGGSLEVLASSSHRETELSLYEAQKSHGPFVDAWTRNDVVAAANLDEIGLRWPRLGESMREEELDSLLVAPLHWDNEPLGALGIFRRGDAPFSDDDRAVAQLFSDLAILAIIHTDHLTIRSAAQRIEDALVGRIVIEQAKGVLAYRHGLSMSDAFEALRDRVANDGGATLTEMAHLVVLEAEAPQ